MQLIISLFKHYLKSEDTFNFPLRSHYTYLCDCFIGHRIRILESILFPVPVDDNDFRFIDRHIQEVRLFAPEKKMDIVVYCTQSANYKNTGVSMTNIFFVARKK